MTDRELLAEARQALQWFIDNDETYSGDEPMPEKHGQTWNEINAYWLGELNKAIAIVAKIDEFLK